MPDAAAPSTSITRPFYVAGHNTNSIEEIRAALDAGANAVEPDVNVYEDRPDEFCVAEACLLDPDEGSDEDAPPITRFLTELHDLAVARPELALVVFDCKPKVATPERGAALLKLIRTLLTHDTGLNVIVSVAKCSDRAIFQIIGGNLGPREGAMIDEENDPVAVSGVLAAADARNVCFGNGISVLNSVLGPHVRPSMERACEFRAAANGLGYIHVWTVDDESLLREYVRIGVDGIITGHPARLRSALGEDEFRGRVRLATRDDNPFLPSNCAYGLEICTADQSAMSPGSVTTFTLTGSVGSAGVALDTSLPCRMDRGSKTYVTLQSGNLGELQSVTVQRSSASGFRDWLLGRIKVVSFHYRVSKQATFNQWIDSTSPVSRPLI